MNYRVIGLMSGSSLDGLDIAYVLFEETAGRWTFELKETACLPYPPEWTGRLAGAGARSARDYLLLDTAYGFYLGDQVRNFIETRGLAFQVQLIASHGHTIFHLPEQRMTAQLGDGAAIAARTGIPVVSNLRSMDIALGGQGAPVVPVGEKWLFPGYDLFLNLGGIANIAAPLPEPRGFDVCPANRVLNELASDLPGGYDEDGRLAATGRSDVRLGDALDALPYYHRALPKSLSNDFGLETVVPLVRAAGLLQADALATYCGHIARQVAGAAAGLLPGRSMGAGQAGTAPFGNAPAARPGTGNPPAKLLATGGGAHNKFLMEKIAAEVAAAGIDLVTADPAITDYKEALVMALMGVLRWRDEVNVFASVTGASRDSINGAVYMP